MEIIVNNCVNCPFCINTEWGNSCFFANVDDMQVCERLTEPMPENCPLLFDTVIVKKK